MSLSLSSLRQPRVLYSWCLAYLYNARYDVDDKPVARSDDYTFDSARCGSCHGQSTFPQQDIHLIMGTLARSRIPPHPSFLSCASFCLYGNRPRQCDYRQHQPSHFQKIQGGNAATPEKEEQWCRAFALYRKLGNGDMQMCL